VVTSICWFYPEKMARPKLDPNGPHVTTQITLRGRSASVLLELARYRTGELAEAARWVIDSWIGGEGRKILMDQYGIDVLAHRPANKVVSIDRKKNEGGRE
jgi:hypothetical protein